MDTNGPHGARIGFVSICVHLWFIVRAEQVAREGHLLFSDLNGLGARRDRAGATR